MDLGSAPVSGPRRRRVTLPGGGEARVLERGEGEPLGFLGGLRGLPRWIPFLDRLAAERRVVAPSLPGFPGGGDHRGLDDPLDWISATLDLLEASELEGADLIGASLGGALAAEVAALSRASLRRLVLIAPLGLFDESERIGATRAEEAAARLLWPTGDLGLSKRLHRIHTPTLLLWGSEDRVVPASYAKRFASRLGGLVSIRSLEGAGHMLELDAPEAAADAILEFLA
jgi:pimeloyl-ACP methyl ester carboxylesterase